MTVYFDLSTQTIVTSAPSNPKVMTLNVVLPNQIAIIAGLFKLAVDLPSLNGHVEVIIPTE